MKILVRKCNAAALCRFPASHKLHFACSPSNWLSALAHTVYKEKTDANPLVTMSYHPSVVAKYVMLCNRYKQSANSKLVHKI